MPWAEVVITDISSLYFKASEGVQGRLDKGPSSERYVQSAMNGLSNSVRLQNPLLSELSEELIARLTKQTARNFEPIIRLQQKPEDATTKTFCRGQCVVQAQVPLLPVCSAMNHKPGMSRFAKVLVL